jgi:hypothetical protein
MPVKKDNGKLSNEDEGVSSPPLKAAYPKKTQSQLISARGELELRRILPTEWTLLQPQEDFGEDFVVDIFEGTPYRTRREVESATATGKCFGVQLKTVERAASNDGYSIAVDLKTSTLNYLANRPYPTFLVLCSLDGRVFERERSIAPPKGDEFRSPQLHFVNLNAFSRLARLGVKGNAGSKYTRVNIPLFNNLNYELNCRQRLLYRDDPDIACRLTGLLDGDPTAEQIELCRIGAACRWPGLPSVLAQTYHTAKSNVVRAEALLAMGLHGRQIDWEIVLPALLADDYMLIISALKALGFRHAVPAREIVRERLLDFARQFHDRWIRLVRVSKDMDPLYCYAGFSEYVVVASSLMRALCTVAGEDDSESVDLLLQYWAQPDRTQVGRYGASLVSELYGRSPPKQKTYMADRLQKWGVALEIKLTKRIKRDRDQDAFVAESIRKLDDQFAADDRD